LCFPQIHLLLVIVYVRAQSDRGPLCVARRTLI
jgi:hypothetical protein